MKKRKKKGIIFTSFHSSNIHQGCRSDYTFSAEDSKFAVKMSVVIV